MARGTLVSEPDRRAPCPCGSGRRYKSCCFPKDRARAGLVDSARVAHAELDEATRVALPLAEAGGHKIACAVGCNACCTSAIRCTPAEARAIAAWLGDDERAAVRAAFIERLGGWRTRVGDDGRALDALLDNGVPKGGAELERFTVAVRTYRAREVLCPFPDAHGACTIYPVRPLPCRATHAVDTAEFCRHDAAHGPSVVRHPRMAAAIDAGQRGMRAAAERAGLDARERLLPEAVAALLAG